MSVNHGGSDIVMAEQFLNRPDVAARVNQMRSKGMTERVTAYEV
jgi:hypothetical protein